MKKITLLLAFVAIAGFSYGQANKQLNFGGLGTGLYVGYEIPVAAAISIVPQFETNWDFDKFVISVKGNYYFDEIFGLTDPWDVYGGLNVGYRLETNNDGVNFGAHVGGRWFWSEKWGLNGEFGGGSGVTGGIGVTMKM